MKEFTAIISTAKIGTPSRFILYLIHHNHVAAAKYPDQQHMTYEELADSTGLSHDRVRKACAPLVKAGLITIEYRRNKGPALIRLVQP